MIKFIFDKLFPKKDHDKMPMEEPPEGILVSVTIKPGMSPIDRGTIEDELWDLIGEDAVFPLGGGTMMGEDSASDFQLIVHDGRSALEIAPACVRFFNGLEFILPTTIELEVDGALHPVSPKHVPRTPDQG